MLARSRQDAATFGSQPPSAACPGHKQAPSKLDRLLVWHLLDVATARVCV